MCSAIMSTANRINTQPNTEPDKNSNKNTICLELREVSEQPDEYNLLRDWECDMPAIKENC